MSDIKSSLPIRSAQDPDQRVQVKLVDGQNPAQMAEIDAAGHVKTKISATDVNGDVVAVKVSEEGKSIISGEYSSTVNSEPSSVGVIAHERNASPTGANQTKRVTAVTSGTTTAMEVAIRDSEGVAITRTNPIPTFNVEDPGEEVQIYNESATDVASGSSDFQEYTVPAGKTLKLDQILASGSGRTKIVIEQSQDGTTFTKVATRFNSTAEPNCDTDLRRIISIPAGGKVKITRHNIDEDPFAMYSTIIGILV